MIQATWNDVVLAQSDTTVVVEGNHYFPPDAVKWEYFKPSTHTTVCGWKGLANYHDIEVNGERNPNAAWYYADPKPEAEQVRGRIAFWKGVKVK